MHSLKEQEGLGLNPGSASDCYGILLVSVSLSICSVLLIRRLNEIINTLHIRGLSEASQEHILDIGSPSRHGD